MPISKIWFLMIIQKVLSITVIVMLTTVLFMSNPEITTANDSPWEKFSLSGGYFIAAADTSLRLGAENIGVSIDAEKLLGLDTSQAVFRIAGSWRFTDNRRHRLDLSWFSFRRSGDKTLLQDIQIEDKDGSIITIPANTEVSSYYDMDIYQANYSYSFFQDDRVDIAALLGVYVMPIDFGIRAVGVLNEEGSADFTAPLPVIGLRTDVALTSKWFLRSGLELFYLEIDSFTGTIFTTHAAIEYIPWKHVGFGLGADLMNLGVESDGEDYPQIDFKGKVDFRYAGAQLYCKIFF